MNSVKLAAFGSEELGSGSGENPSGVEWIRATCRITRKDVSD